MTPCTNGQATDPAIIHGHYAGDDWGVHLQVHEDWELSMRGEGIGGSSGCVRIPRCCIGARRTLAAQKSMSQARSGMWFFFVMFLVG